MFVCAAQSFRLVTFDYLTGVAIDKRLSIANIPALKCLLTNVCQWSIFVKMSIDKRLSIANIRETG